MGSSVGAIAGGVTSLFGGRARRIEERQSREQYQTNQAELDNYQFQNSYLGLQNTAEDLTVNQQAFQAQAQQADAGLAQGLDAIVQTGGGGGGAQAIANAALQSRQGISASIAQQEQANLQARSVQAAQNQLLERQGADQLQTTQFNQINDRYDRSAQRYENAQAARQQATSDLVGGIVGAGSIVAGGLIGGADTFAGNLQNNATAFGIAPQTKNS